MIANKLVTATGGLGGAAYIIATNDNSPGISAFRWTTQYGFGTRYSSPGGDANAMKQPAISRDGSRVAAARFNSPYAIGYAWDSGSGFGSSTSPSTAPAGEGLAVAFNPDSTAIAVAHKASPYISAYLWSSGAFSTKYSNPGTLPAGEPYVLSRSVAFSPDGKYLAVSHATSPYVTVYNWSGSGFGSKIANPSTLPPGTGCGLAFTAGAVFVGFDGSPYVYAYAFNAGFGAKFTDPSTAATAAGYTVAISPAGNAMVFGNLDAYQWSDSAGFGSKYTKPGTYSAVGYWQAFVFTPKADAIIYGNSSGTLSAVAWDYTTGFGSVYTNSIAFTGGGGCTGLAIKAA